MIPIDRADDSAHDMLTSLLTAAFLDSELGPWLIPDRQERASVYPTYFGIFVEHYLQHGRVDIIGRDAAAFWQTVGSQPDEIPDYNTRLAAAVGDALPRFQALDEVMHAHHPTQKHSYLAFVAVRPRAQNQGLGTALLRHYHLDDGGLPAYLEATGNRNKALYHRLGYEPLEPFCTGDSPALHPMWRPEGCPAQQ